MFLSRSTEKQAGHDLYWFIIDLLLIDSKNLAELILCVFFVHLVKYEFCAYLAFFLFSQMPFKRKLCVYLILQNRQIFAKKNTHAKISTIKLDIIRIPIRWHHQK